jgi:hypothetical protein
MTKRSRPCSPPEPVETTIEGKTYTGSFYIRDEYVHVTGPGGGSSGPVRFGPVSAYSMARLALGEIVMKAKLNDEDLEA